jgi:hypothetical protein
MEPELSKTDRLDDHGARMAYVPARLGSVHLLAINGRLAGSMN